MVEGLAQLDQIMLTVLGLRFWVASSQKSCFFFFERIMRWHDEAHVLVEVAVCTTSMNWQNCLVWVHVRVSRDENEVPATKAIGSI